MVWVVKGCQERKIDSHRRYIIQLRRWL